MTDRGVKVLPKARVSYCITECSNLVDAYKITPTGLDHLSSRSLLPPSTPPLNSSSFRGDTLLSPSTPSHPVPRALFATTRGANPSVRGWLSTFRLDEDGLFVDHDHGDASGDPGLDESELESEYWETPTSGGKANALDVVLKDQEEGEGGLDTPDG